MTPRKCSRHELQPGELGDSPRYLRALTESRTCWRCRARVTLAVAIYRWRQFTGAEP